MLEIASSRLETEAREARRQAQLALVRPAPALVTKSVEPAARRPRALTTKDCPEIADAVVAGINRALEQLQLRSNRRRSVAVAFPIDGVRPAQNGAHEIITLNGSDLNPLDGRRLAVRTISGTRWRGVFKNFPGGKSRRD